MLRACLHIAFIAALTVGFAWGCLATGGADALPDGVRKAQHTAPTGRVASLRAGPEQAPRVIYVHGTPGGADNFTALLRAPVDGRESIAIDRPGFGESEPRQAVVELARQAEAIEPLLVVREGRAPVLVGHSLGAPIVLEAAATWPERVGGLVLVAGSVDPALEEWQWFNRLGAGLAWVLPRALENANDEIAALRAELQALAPRLADVRCPVVIVHGRRDGLVPYENVAYLERALCNVAWLQVISLDAGDHFLPWNAVPTLREAIGRLCEAEPEAGSPPSSTPASVPSSP